MMANAVKYSCNMLEIFCLVFKTKKLQFDSCWSVLLVPLSVCQRCGQRWGEVHDPGRLRPAVSGTAHSNPPQSQNCAAHRRRRWHHKGRVRALMATLYDTTEQYIVDACQTSSCQNRCGDKISRRLLFVSHLCRSSSCVLGNVCVHTITGSVDLVSKLVQTLDPNILFPQLFLILAPSSLYSLHERIPRGESSTCSDTAKITLALAFGL